MPGIRGGVIGSYGADLNHGSLAYPLLGPSHVLTRVDLSGGVQEEVDLDGNRVDDEEVSEENHTLYSTTGEVN